MKYIKSFENINDEDDRFYIIFDRSDKLLIFEITPAVFSEDINVKNFLQLFEYDKKYNKIHKSESDIGEFDYENLSKKQNILYKSNNLQDCIDNLPLINGANKYNL